MYNLYTCNLTVCFRLKNILFKYDTTVDNLHDTFSYKYISKTYMSKYSDTSVFEHNLFYTTVKESNQNLQLYTIQLILPPKPPYQVIPIFICFQQYTAQYSTVKYNNTSQYCTLLETMTII